MEVGRAGTRHDMWIAHLDMMSMVMWDQSNDHAKMCGETSNF